MSKKKIKQAPDTGAESNNEPEAPTRPEQPKQTYIPGTEPPSIPDLDDAMEVYQDIKGRRCALTAKETEAKQSMVALAKAHADKIGKDSNGVLKYKSDHLVLVIAPKDEAVSVKPVSDDDEDVTVGSAPKDNTEGEQ